MKKITYLFSVIILLIPFKVVATRGCCSSHGGVDCSKIQSNGKVVCEDGWTGSSCDYSSMVKCSGTTPSNNGSGNGISATTSTKSSDIGVTVKVNDRVIKFTDYISEIANIPSDENLKIDYTLNDTKATAKLNYDKYIYPGNYTCSLIVIAENGHQQKYTINVYKEEKTIAQTGSVNDAKSVKENSTETNENSASPVVGIGITGVAAYGIFTVLKKIKK